MARQELTRSVRECSQPRGCCEDWEERLRLVVGGSVRRPGVEVLAHGGEHDAKEPALTARDASVVEAEVELLAFDGTFGTRATVGVEFPERASRAASVRTGDSSGGDRYRRCAHRVSLNSRGQSGDRSPVAGLSPRAGSAT